MKIKKIFNLFLIVFCLFMLASCNDKENQNQGYDGRVFDISLSQNLGAVLLEGTNAKYLYVVRKIAADNIDLYYIIDII